MTDWKFKKLTRSPNPDKKWRVVMYDSSEDKTKNIDFGAAGYEDFTMHKDPKRKALYISRHSGMGEDWKKTGILTPGFWSRWLLWNLPTIEASLADLRKRFQI